MPLTLLDHLTQRFPEHDRDTLYRLVMAGDVRVGGITVTDPRHTVSADVALEISQQRYVSRAGFKLEAAIEAFAVDVAGLVWIDAGASTGGFTDCLLQRGAAHVHAVDVGYNQLHFRIRRDERVTVHERTNIREIGSLDPPPHAAVVDLSFRSLRGVLAHILEQTSEGWGIALLKPQFELAAEARWGRVPAERLHDGVVEPVAGQQVAERVSAELAGERISIDAIRPSPLAGRRGNVEFLALARLTGRGEPD